MNILNFFFGSFKSRSFALNSQDLKDFIEKTLQMKDSNKSDSVNESLVFILSENSKLLYIDGFQMNLNDIEVSNLITDKSSFAFGVNMDTVLKLNELLRFARSFLIEFELLNSGNLKIKYGSDLFEVKMKNFDTLIRPILKMLEAEDSVEFKLSKGALQSLVNTPSGFTISEDDIASVLLLGYKDESKLLLQHNGKGTALEIAISDPIHNDFQVKLDSRRLLSILNSINTDGLVIGVIDGKSQVRFKSSDNSSEIFMLMPMQLG